MKHDFKTSQQNVVKVGKDKANLEDLLRRKISSLRIVEEELEMLSRQGENPKAIQQKRKLLKKQQELTQDIKTGKKGFLEKNTIYSLAREKFEKEYDYSKQPEFMDDSIPFLLFPVRIETRFMKDAKGDPELRVRIFPDDIAVDTHEDDLTLDEEKAGHIYWQEVWRSGGVKEREKGAWNLLVEKYDAPRAAWIAQETKPENDTEKPDTEMTPEEPFVVAPKFPNLSLKSDSWTRPPKSYILPDRFVVMTYRDGKEAHKVKGNRVPDPLILGPDPEELDTIIEQNPISWDIARGKNGVFDPLKPERKPVENLGGAKDRFQDTLKIVGGMEWMTDFDKAEAMGMAVRIPLKFPEDKKFDRILVLGIRSSSDKNDGKERLERLFLHHQYNEGLKIIPQGDPTNNSKTKKSGFSSDEGADKEGFRGNLDGPRFTNKNRLDQKSDGQRLSEGLGIDKEVLHFLENSEGKDGLEAIAMQKALWPATLGYFMEEMMNPLFKSETIKKTREFFTKFVSGRGFLSAVRIGNQPYGILPSTVFSRWKDKPRGKDDFFKKLIENLKILDGIWDEKIADVTFAGSTNDPSQELLDILGLHSSSVEFYRRIAVGPKYIWNKGVFEGLPSSGIDKVRLISFLTYLFQELGFDWDGLPAIWDMTFFDKADPIQKTPLIDEAPLSEIRRLKDLYRKARPGYKGDYKNYINWLRTSSISTIRNQKFAKDENGKKIKAPKALLYNLLRHSVLLANWDAAMNIHIKNGTVERSARVEKELVNMFGRADTTRWDYMYQRVPIKGVNMNMDRYLRSKEILDLDEALELREQLDSLKILELLPTARLERLLVEHLDLCSYRLDAWQLGGVHERLNSQRIKILREVPGRRSATPSSVLQKGIFIGAYGWLENLEIAEPPQQVADDEIPDGFQNPARPLTYQANNGGFIHGPSPNHAITAAILRSGYQTHANSEKADLLSINLSSERVRRAIWFLEGVRNGQPLGALLGYQFERGLHENYPDLNLDQYILLIRKKYPLVADKITNRDENENSIEEPIEAVEARNVVDGLKILKAAKKENYPYGVNGLPGAILFSKIFFKNREVKKAIIAEVDRMAETFDAISDLLISEGVFQVTQGNFDKAGAALEAISKGQRIYEDPDIVRTQVGGIAMTHRITLNFDENSPAKNPWINVPMTPAATAEPQLNHWLGSMLGVDPSKVKCIVCYRGVKREVSLEDLKVQPIDFIYMTGQEFADEETELEMRIGYYVRKLYNPDQKIPVNIKFIDRDDNWGIDVKTFFEIFPLATTLRRIITGSRALAADDFTLPPEEEVPVEDIKGYKLDELRKRLVDFIDNSEGKWSLRDIREKLKQNLNDPVKRVQYLFNAAGFGVLEAIPTHADEASQKIQANNVISQLREKFDQAIKMIGESANASSTEEELELLLNGAKFIFGPSFKIMPRFNFKNVDELDLAFKNHDTILNGSDPLAVDEWLQSLSAVRPATDNYITATLLAESFEHPVPKTIIAQLPFSEDDRWIALPLKNGQSFNGPKLALAMNIFKGYEIKAGQFGLLLDDYVEKIPHKECTTGIVFNYDQPNSEPPNSLILAITPEITGNWKWQDLVDILDETLEMAKKRAVEPDQLNETPIAHLIPAIVAAYNFPGLTIGMNWLESEPSLTLHSDPEETPNE